MKKAITTTIENAIEQLMTELEDARDRAQDAEHQCQPMIPDNIDIDLDDYSSPEDVFKALHDMLMDAENAAQELEDAKDSLDGAIDAIRDGISSFEEALELAQEDHDEDEDESEGDAA